MVGDAVISDMVNSELVPKVVWLLSMVPKTTVGAWEMTPNSSSLCRPAHTLGVISDLITGDLITGDPKGLTGIVEKPWQAAITRSSLAICLIETAGSKTNIEKWNDGGLV